MSTVNPDSDINYIPPILGFFIGIIAVVAAFLFVGAFAGIIVLLVVLAFAIWIVFRLLSQNED